MTNSTVLSKQDATEFTRAQLLAKTMRGFGDPTRVRILELLLEDERTVNELVEILQAPQSRVSNHLSCLRWCNFVTTRRDGQRVYYSVADDRVKAIINLAESFMADNSEYISACLRIKE